MTNNSFSRILIFALHSDDGEFGCGGSIAKIVKERDLFNNPITIPNGFNTDIFIYLKEKEKFNDKRITKLISVGRISPIKGYDILMQSLEKVK